MPEQVATVRNLIGCNMSLRRKVFQTAGKFRIGRVGVLSVGLENDDTEMCIRVHQHIPNCIFLYDPSICVVNHRVPLSRRSFQYFAKRCISEGISKARLSNLVGTEVGLSSERAYATRTLPQGVLRGFGDAVRGDLSGIARAFSITAGLVITGFGYCIGKILPVPTVVSPASSTSRSSDKHVAEIN